MRESVDRDSQAYIRPLETVTLFNYLGRVLMAGDDECPAVMINLKKVRKSWAQLTRILGREGANLRVSGMFFKAVVQVVLLFGSETWVMIPCMERALKSFQHRFVRRITGSQTRRREEGGCYYPPMATYMEFAVFEEIGVYILKIKNTFAQYIAAQSFLELCERSVSRLGALVYWRW